MTVKTLIEFEVRAFLPERAGTHPVERSGDNIGILRLRQPGVEVERRAMCQLVT